MSYKIRIQVLDDDGKDKTEAVLLQDDYERMEAHNLERIVDDLIFELTDK